MRRLNHSEGNMTPTKNSLSSSRLGFVGAGNMARALARGTVESGLVSRENVLASDVSPAAREAFRQATGVETVPSNRELVQRSDVIILAVKPQHVPEVLEEIAAEIGPHHLVISIAAGIPTGFLERLLPPGRRVVRAMPNTPMLVQRGATALCTGAAATPADLQLARDLFETASLVVTVEESLMAAVTAVSGSGPAYVFFLAEALIRAAGEQGLSAEQAEVLVRRTILGAAELLQDGEVSAEELRRRVTSKGGTTEAALSVLQQRQWDAALTEAVAAAARRSAELAPG